jgi:hypothetical protein
VRNTRRDPQGVEPSGVRFGIAFPCPSNDHTVNERKETAILPPYLRRGLGALKSKSRPVFPKHLHDLEFQPRELRLSHPPNVLGHHSHSFFLSTKILGVLKRESSSRNHRVALKTRSITLSEIILAAPIAPASLPKVETRS